MPASAWKQATHVHRILWGNSYSWIQRDNGNRTIGLYLMNPARMRVETQAGVPIYYFKNNAGKDISYRYEQILHIPGVSYDGVTGYPVIQLAREALGLGLAQEEFNARFYGAGTNVGGTLKTPNKLSSESKVRLKEQILKEYSGLSNAKKLLLLDEGLEFQSMTMPLEDAQFIESRAFQVQEVARWLNMPPHKLKDLGNATYTNIEHQSISFYQDTIRPKLEKDEAYFSAKLLNDIEKEKLIIEYNFKSLLRTDMKTRFEAMQIAKNNSTISVNEWRQAEGLNIISEPWADKHTMPLNMTYAEDFDPNAKPEPTEPTEEPPEDIEEENMYLGFEKRYGTRKANTISQKTKTIKAYRPIFFDIASKIVNKDVANLRGMINKRSLAKDIDTYFDSKLKPIMKEFKKAYVPYADKIYRIVKDEIDVKSTGYDKKIKGFITTVSKRYIEDSKGQLKSIIKDSENLEDDLEQRLLEWEEKRPEKIAHRESVDGMGGLSAALYFMSGFKMIWITTGKSCPYCNSLDGQVISEGESFLSPGDELKGEGQDPMQVTTYISHPQAHQGCDCVSLAV